jgi:hypothetical protein
MIAIRREQKEYKAEIAPALAIMLFDATRYLDRVVSRAKVVSAVVEGLAATPTIRQPWSPSIREKGEEPQHQQRHGCQKLAEQRCNEFDLSASNNPRPLGRSR